MRSIVSTVPAGIAGALDVVAGPDGVVLHRTPATARARLADVGLDFMSMIPSGVRFEAVTDATVIEIDVDLTRARREGAASTGTAFDLVVDGGLREPVVATVAFFDPATGGTRFETGGPTTVRFELGAAAVERRAEIWFPASAAMRLLDLRIPETATLRPAPASGPLWVHHGSSISQCSEADRPTGTWPAIVARRSGLSLINLGLGGQCHLDQFAARAIRDLPATVISLELGINIVNAGSMNQRTFVSALHGFLDTVRDGHPRTPVTVISPIVCRAADDRPFSLSAVRGILWEHVDRRRAEGDPNLHFVDGLTLFGPDDAGDLPDGVHPNSAGYRRIGDRFVLPR